MVDVRMQVIIDGHRVVLETVQILDTTEMIETFALLKARKIIFSSSICHVKHVRYSKCALSLSLCKYQQKLRFLLTFTQTFKLFIYTHYRINTKLT